MSRERAGRTGGGATARCWRRHRMGIKRARAVIREEFQSGGGVMGARGGGCKKVAIKKLQLVLLVFKHCQPPKNEALMSIRHN